ncbi:MAG: TIGR02300 family protein [Stellaceae bacterium]
MTKAEWGTKRICPNCGTRYYDMRRHPIMCPKCGAPFDTESLVKTRKSRAATPAVVAEDVAPLEEELEADLAAEPDGEGAAVTEIPAGEEAKEEAEEETTAAKAGKGKGRGKGADDKEKKKGDDEEEDEEVPEDASELGEDEDDMAEVIENVDEEDER